MSNRLLTPRVIDAAPFAWLHKAAIWRIREAFDSSTYLDQALAVYLVLTELASDEQSPKFAAARRKIAERSGVSIRRVSEILERLKHIKLLTWKQNFIEGTKELAPSTYTLMSCLPRTTSGRQSTGLGTDEKTKNCTVNKQSSEESFEESGEKGKPPEAAQSKGRKREPWKLLKDRKAHLQAIIEQKELSNPDQDVINFHKGELAKIKSEMKALGIKAGNSDLSEPLSKPNPRNAGVIVGPTDYGTAKPRAQRERAQREKEKVETEQILQPGPDLANRFRKEARQAMEAGV